MFLCVHPIISVTEYILDWMNCGLLVKNVTVSTLDRYTIVNNMDNSIDVLPAVHALTGYNTTSKAGTKSAACQ